MRGRLGYLWAKGLRRLRGTAIASSRVHSTSTVEPGSAFIGSSMGRHSFCGYDCEIVNTDIGPFVSIANYVAIGGGRHPLEWVGMSPVFYAGRDSVAKKLSEFERPEPLRTNIGADVWVGYRAIIMQGVQIGTGAVIGAGSVITRDVEPYSICAGSPARHIRYRFDEDLRQRLIRSAWWEKPDSVLERCAHAIRDPEAFLAELARCE